MTTDHPPPFGGERPGTVFAEAQWLDSGRSALRWWLRHGGTLPKRWWLPDFICPVVDTVFREAGLSIHRYRIDDALLPQLPVRLEADEGLYLHPFFGVPGWNDRQLRNLQPGALILDDVFSPVPRTPAQLGIALDAKVVWASFNSQRKALGTHDGAWLLSRHGLPSPPPGPAPFVVAKIEGRARKQARKQALAQVGDQSGPASEGGGEPPVVTEQAYLDAFAAGEASLNQQQACFAGSASALAEVLNQLADWPMQQGERHERWELAAQYLEPWRLQPYPPTFPVQFPFVCRERDAVRQALADAGIYLPVFWPGLDHPLSGEMLSLPLHPDSNREQFEQVCARVRAQLEAQAR